MPTTAYCGYCRRPMPDAWSGQKYCKRGCKENARKKRARAVDRAQRRCFICTSPIPPDSARWRYCSNPCARIGQRHKAQRWHYDHGLLRNLNLVHGHIGSDTEYDSSVYREVIKHDPCAFCGRPSTHIDHITPRFKDGSDRWDNLAPLCHLCNQRKGPEDLLVGLLRCDGLRRARACLLEYGALFVPNVQIRNLDREDLIR